MSDTVARGRKAIEVTAESLQAAISDLEKMQPDGKFPNRAALWTALQNSEWAKTRNPRPLTAQVGMLLAKKFNTTLQTPVGKRGKEKGQGPVNTGTRKPKKVSLDVLSDVFKAVPEQFHGLVKKANNGSLKARHKLVCLQCTNWQKKEVALCTITNCVSWTARPYVNKDSLTVEGRKRISSGEHDEPEQENEHETNSTGTMV